MSDRDTAERVRLMRRDANPAAIRGFIKQLVAGMSADEKAELLQGPCWNMRGLTEEGRRGGRLALMGLMLDLPDEDVAKTLLDARSGPVARARLVTACARALQDEVRCLAGRWRLSDEAENAIVEAEVAMGMDTAERSLAGRLERREARRLEEVDRFVRFDTVDATAYAIMQARDGTVFMGVDPGMPTRIIDPNVVEDRPSESS